MTGRDDNPFETALMEVLTLLDAPALASLAEPAATALQQARTVARVALAPSAPENDTPDTIDRLLTLVGPEQGEELLARFRADLLTIRQDLPVGAEKQDREALRLCLHNLISISGTAGATELWQEAQENYASLAKFNHKDINTAVSRLIVLLDDVIDYLDMKKELLSGQQGK
ncbi:MAG: hypothetical protein ACK5M4_03975 [Pseudorhodobacter sp.]